MARRQQLVDPPIIDTLELTDLTPGTLGEFVAPDGYIEGYDFCELAADAIDVEGTRYVQCRISQLRAEVQLRAVSLTETRLEHIDTPVLRACRGQWRDVEVLNSRIGFAELYESGWRSVRFEGCKLGFVNLRGTKLQDVAFTDCTIEELDIGSADALRVALAGTRIGRLTLPHATLRHVDLRGAELAGIAGIESLRGAVISENQLLEMAPFFAAQLGIVVD